MSWMGFACGGEDRRSWSERESALVGGVLYFGVSFSGCDNSLRLADLRGLLSNKSSVAAAFSSLALAFAASILLFLADTTCSITKAPFDSKFMLAQLPISI